MRTLPWKRWLAGLGSFLTGLSVLAASPGPDLRLPVRGLCIGAPSPGQVDRFVEFIQHDLASRQANTLILRVDYGFRYTSHPEVGEPGGLSVGDIRKLVSACRSNAIHLIPQINLLGHQSWAGRVGNLLKAHPEFDETPWVAMPEKYAWPNADRLYCKSYCPLHPKVHDVVFALVDEVCDAFEADAFHAGLDEVFYLGEEKCPRCSGKDKAELFAGEVTRIRDHLAKRGRKLWLWGDRLLDGTLTGLGEWEASANGTARAVDLVPRDVMICDWHYDRAEPTAAYFALKGLPVVSCPWKKPQVALRQVQAMIRLREDSNALLRDRCQGVLQTVWSGANRFLDEYQAYVAAPGATNDRPSEAACFVKTFEALADNAR